MSLSEKLVQIVVDLQESAPDRHGNGCSCHHSHQLPEDTWIQLQVLQALLCQRPPRPVFHPEVLEDIDSILQHRVRQSLLTASESIPPAASLPESNVTLRLWKGDITTLSNTTAIVNAANSALLGCFNPNHRCIDNVIHSVAGPRLREACYRLMSQQSHTEPVGAVKVTPGFNLPAQYVLHTVGPQLRNGRGGTAEPTEKQKQQLAACYRSCLEAAENLPALPDGRKILAFCCISTGVFAFPAKLAVEIAVDGVVKWCEDHPSTSLTDVIFNVFLESDWELYQHKLAGLKYSTLHLDPDLESPALRHSSHASIRKARQWIQEADALIISAGAGLSAAIGLDYTSPALFKQHFPAFFPLGLRRLYDVFGFNGWDSGNQKWGYYFQELNMVRCWPASSVYAQLLQLASGFGADYFIRTSNADGLFVANGFDPRRVSTPQGQYRYLQCLAKCRRNAVFESAPLVDAALPHIDPATQCLTDSSMIPGCKYCGGELTLCVRGGDYFNQAPFAAQERKYAEFLEQIASESKTTVILELGVGMNTPSVLRWHNEDLVEEYPQVKLIRAGIGASGTAPWHLEERNQAIGILGDLKEIIPCLTSPR
ncbi:Appr-1-p processing enzyme family protein [Aspergillus clavatus NRRL 1]|uniref:Appr-1-p processing enzyme family protein n=1 Tax=Aspergillus clavatus (strain ATCC 1007 / CBS 513.65 / DSM 816 / NCTC 3887 / NRRL 1 / QM 1276 / 107) TaxID=344612 RepID=A1CAU9_ASPCL|nr:Appr-1-p processing enzyme family protein [Aspergillus clavatus NRRL 1]EAW12867.1 Appr-1-p processing enzyme family protein [Aspergillus clavatus NRRL 1]